MKLKLLVFLLPLLQNLQAQTHKSVYFIGNSYTGTNNLPELIKNTAQAQGDTFYYESHTPGGSTFFQHAANSTVLAKLNQGTWDHVVLQEQSQTPTFPNGQVNATMFPQAQTLVQTARNANPCTVPIFYMTWGYKYGDSSNCPYLPYVCTYEDMDDVIAYRYMLLAQANQSLVSPVGQVWRAIRNQYPTYELYVSDNSHPTLLGSMAAAYTFYTILYKKDPATLLYNSSLSTQQAQNIKNIVREVVYNNMEDWFVGTHDNPTKFNYTQNNQTVNFTNQSTNATSFLWDFNDGSTSTQENPIHTYTQNGTYTVTLTTNACNQTSTFTKTVTVANLSVQNPSPKFRIYPNPTTTKITIDYADIQRIELYNLEGKKLQCALKNNELNLSHLASGVYILKISNSHGQTFNQKIIKN